MTRTRTALVIGGIVGPVAVMPLRQSGIEATVYEAHLRSTEGIGCSSLRLSLPNAPYTC